MAANNDNDINEENLLLNGNYVSHPRISHIPRFNRLLDNTEGLGEKEKCNLLIDRMCDNFLHLPNYRQYFEYQNDNGLYTDCIRPQVKEKCKAYLKNCSNLIERAHTLGNIDANERKECYKWLPVLGVLFLRLTNLDWFDRKMIEFSTGANASQTHSQKIFLDCIQHGANTVQLLSFHETRGQGGAYRYVVNHTFTDAVLQYTDQHGNPVSLVKEDEIAMLNCNGYYDKCGPVHSWYDFTRATMTLGLTNHRIVTGSTANRLRKLGFGTAADLHENAVTRITDPPIIIDGGGSQSDISGVHQDSTVPVVSESRSSILAPKKLEYHHEDRIDEFFRRIHTEMWPKTLADKDGCYAAIDKGILLHDCGHSSPVINQVISKNSCKTSLNSSKH